jgi:Sec-independent protein secretion pathway component TatC
MLSAWRYIILISTILGAILTPSTDPLTQLLLSLAILLLYFSGLEYLVFNKELNYIIEYPYLKNI